MENRSSINYNFVFLGDFLSTRNTIIKLNEVKYVIQFPWSKYC